MVKSRLDAQVASALSQLQECYSVLEREDETKRVLEGLTLAQVNYILWKCSPEELDWSDRQRDVYDVPGFGKFVYAGLGGLAIEFKRMGLFNNLGHAIFTNMRAGDWLIDYHSLRISKCPLPDSFSAFYLSSLSNIKLLPRGSIPKHFVKFVLGLFHALKFYVTSVLFEQGLELASSEDSFVESLAFAATQFFGDVKSAKTHMMTETLAAGLPHFSIGFMRCWGRDTFIAFKGLLLHTGRFTEAEDVLTTFASTVQHGLIPNLLDGGNKPRYNARDATWWFLQAVKDYITIAPNGKSLLSRSVNMRFPGEQSTQSLSDIVQSILQAHASGIHFTEKNAGTEIDAHMRGAGFDVNIRLDPATGFIHGGNLWNCGTWMDKMGSSDKAGNRGIPATPRDGADVEIIGLLYSVLVTLHAASVDGVHPYQGVHLHDGRLFTYADWADHILQSFEPWFWIPESGSSPHAKEDLIRVRGIYKDMVGCDSQESEYKLRPNQCIAMAVAPELFDREHAAIALRNIDAHLLPEILTGEQLGVRTLNEEDPRYRPSYNNSEDSDVFATAHGYSYHCGPEWVWPLGHVLLAKLHFQQCSASHVMAHVSNLRKHIADSPWMSLPELTNKSGAFCKDSAAAQAWSVATVLDALLQTPKLEYDEF